MLEVGGQAEAGADHAVANFRDQFLEGIGFAVGEAAKPVKAAPVAAPVDRLMGKGGIKSGGTVKGRNRRHMDEVGTRVVVGARVAAGANVRTGGGKESVKLGIGDGAKVTRSLGGVP